MKVGRGRGVMCCTRGRAIQSALQRKVWVAPYHVVLLLYMSAVQVYSNSSEVATLYPNQTSFTFTQLTPGTLYLMSVGAFTDAGEGEREEQMVQTDSVAGSVAGAAKKHILT